MTHALSHQTFVPWGDPTFERLLAHCSEFSTVDIDLHAACVAEVVHSARTHNATMAPKPKGSKTR